MNEHADSSVASASSGPSASGKWATVLIRLILVGLLAVMVVLVQQHASEWPVKLFGATVSKDGTVWVSLQRNDKQRPEIWRWDKRLQNGTKAMSLFDTPTCCNAAFDNRVLVILGRQQLRGVDTKTGRTLWRRTAAGGLFEMKILADDSHVLFVDDLNDPVVRVLNAQTGEKVSQWVSDARAKQYLVDSETLAIERENEWVVFRWSGGALNKLEQADDVVDELQAKVPSGQTEVWDPDSYGRLIWEDQRTIETLRPPSKLMVGGELVEAAHLDGTFIQLVGVSWPRTGAEIRIVSSNGEVLHQKILQSSTKSRRSTASKIALIGTLFVLLLVGDGSLSTSPWRYYFDAVFLWALFAFLFYGWGGLRPMDWSSGELLRGLPSTVAWLGSVAFLVLATTKRRLYVWIGLGLACCTVFLLPSVLLAMVCHWFGFRWPNSPRDARCESASANKQFTIADVMLATAAVALLIAVIGAMGSSTAIGMLVLGSVFSVLVFISFLLLQFKGFACVTLAAATFGSCLTLLSQDAVFVSTMGIPTLTFVSFSYFSIRVPPASFLGEGVVETLRETKPVSGHEVNGGGEASHG